MYCSSSSVRRRPVCIHLCGGDLSRENRYIRCCRLGRRRRNSAGSRRICSYVCCIDSTVSRDGMLHSEGTETYRHATQAVETQRRFEGSSSSCKACFFRLRCLGLGAWVAPPDVASWPTASCTRFCDMILHVQYLASQGMFSISSETKTACGAAGADTAIEGERSTIGCSQGWAQSDALAMLSNQDISDQRAELSHVCI